MPDDERAESPALTDGELCLRVQAGDPNAFWQLAERYVSFIRAKAVRFQGQGLDNEDLSQEGMLGLLSAARFYQPGRKASFKTYADVCIRNRMITAVRRAQRQSGGEAAHLSLNSGQGALELPADPSADPQALLADSESYGMLLQKISSSLSRLEREVLFLRLQGCSYGEAAKRLRTTEKAVGNAVQRARAKLKKLFPLE